MLTILRISVEIYCKKNHSLFFFTFTQHNKQLPIFNFKLNFHNFEAKGITKWFVHDYSDELQKIKKYFGCNIKKYFELKKDKKNQGYCNLFD